MSTLYAPEPAVDTWRMCPSHRRWHRLLWHCTRPMHFDDHHVYQVTS